MATNKETALKIWDRDYGKQVQEVEDFSGRKIQRGAYDQNGSKYCWNIDHVLPKSHGGKNNSENLICTHILTNQEKGASFPCFSANGKNFQIVKANSKWIIEEIQKENKKSFAIKMWNIIFGKEIILTKDYTGRSISKDQHGSSDGNGGWDIDYYVKGDNTHENIYIANVFTIAERAGKTTFDVGNIKWQYKNNDDKKGFTIFDNRPNLFEPNQVMARIIKPALQEDEDKQYISYIIVKYNPGYYSNGCKNKQFHDCLIDFVGYQIEDFSFESNFDKNYFVYEFNTPNKEDIQKVYNLATLIKTYGAEFNKNFNINNFAIYAITIELDAIDCNSSFRDVLNCDNLKTLRNMISSNYYDSGIKCYVNGLLAYNIKDKITQDNKYDMNQLYENIYIYSELSKKLNK